MIDRALVYLLLARLRNTVKNLFRRPGRALALAFTLLLLVTISVTGGIGRSIPGEARATVVATLLAFNLLLAVLGGLGEQGLGFTPADLDFVLPAPFTRRDLLLYHFLRHYAGSVLLALLYTLFLGPFEHEALAWLGIFLCLASCTHLQAASTLSVAALGARVFARLRLAARVLLVTVVGAGALLALVATLGEGDVGAMLGRVLSSDVARVLLLPALSGAEVAVAGGYDEAAWPLLWLWLAVGGTFLLAAAFRVDFLEASLETTVASQRRRQGVPTAETATARSSRGFAAGVGSVVWLNLLTLRRRLRMVVGALFLLAILILVTEARAEGRARATFPPLVGVLAFFALMANLPLGFRGTRTHLAYLKTLPFHPTSLAFAQVVVPAGIVYLLQMAVAVAFVAAGRLDPAWVLGALVAFPLLDVGVVALTELVQLGREPQRMGLLATMVQMAALLVSLLPAIVLAAVAWSLVGHVAAAVAAGALAQAGVDVLVLALLGRRFARHEGAAADA
jgi:hypothetical protein